MPCPERKRLPHVIPSWIDPSSEVYFLTLNTIPRGCNQLARSEVSQALFESVAFRVKRGLWWPRLVLLMPDHLHALVVFPPSAKSIRSIVADWKGWVAKRLAIRWQADFFEHRIRREESLREKADYILENPVRAGLVKDTRDWPYVWFADGERPSR